MIRKAATMAPGRFHQGFNGPADGAADRFYDRSDWRIVADRVTPTSAMRWPKGSPRPASSSWRRCWPRRARREWSDRTPRDAGSSTWPGCQARAVAAAEESLRAAAHSTVVVVVGTVAGAIAEEGEGEGLGLAGRRRRRRGRRRRRRRRREEEKEEEVLLNRLASSYKLLKIKNIFLLALFRATTYFKDWSMML